jgi:hypothetical protein
MCVPRGIAAPLAAQGPHAQGHAGGACTGSSTVCVSCEASVCDRVSSPSSVACGAGGAAEPPPRARCAVASELCATFMISLCARAAGPVGDGRSSASPPQASAGHRRRRSASVIRIPAASRASCIRGRAVLGRARPAGGTASDPLPPPGAMRAESGRRGDRASPRSSMCSLPRRKRLRWALAGRAEARAVPAWRRQRDREPGQGAGRKDTTHGTRPPARTHARTQGTRSPAAADPVPALAGRVGRGMLTIIR